MAITDDFNRGTLGSNWTNQALNGSVPGIVSNAAWSTTASSFAMMYWSANTWNAAHHSRVKMLGTNYVGPGVRHSGSGAGTNCYVYFSHGSLQKFVAGFQTVIATFGTIAPAGTPNDILEIDVTGNSTIGNTLITTKNGAVGTAAPPDSALNAGSAGMAWYSNTAGGDDWVGTGEVTAGTSYTLTALPGTYASSGTSAALKAARRVAATAGTYALTGTAASLKAARRLTASATTYTYTGTAATLTKTGGGSHTLVAGSGTYAVTGTALALRLRLGVTAGSGTYTLTGTAAVLRGPDDVLPPGDLVTTTFLIQTLVARTATLRTTVTMTAER
jgi:hypothetical protein